MNPRIFYIDGWKEGREEGRKEGREEDVTDGHLEVKKHTFFENISKTARFFFLVVWRPIRRVSKTFSGKFSKMKSEIFPIKKFRTIFF